MRRRRSLALVLSLFLPLSAAAQDPVQEVRDCLKRNIPKLSSTQSVQFVSTDRIGGQREFRAKMLGMKMPDNLRRSKLCIKQPPDMRGTELLSIETEGGAPDSFLYTPELKKPKRITGEGLGGSVFGTDFTYEDLQRWQQLNRPERHERLPDGEIDGRPVYVMSTVPSEGASSAYTRVLSYVDKQTCVVIKSESFESGDRLRKLFTASTENMIEDNGVHVPTEVVMKDVRDETQTTVTVEDVEIDAGVEERSFQVSSLGRHCR